MKPINEQVKNGSVDPLKIRPFKIRTRLRYALSLFR